MKRGTTYPITITVPGRDLRQAAWIIVTFKPPYVPAFEFSRDELSLSSDGTDTVIALQLSQQQSLSLTGGGAKLDVNWELDGMREGTILSDFIVSATLLERAVTGNG